MTEQQQNVSEPETNTNEDEAVQEVEELDFEVVHKGQSEYYPTKADAMAKAKELSKLGRSSAVLTSKDKTLRMVFRFGKLDEMVINNVNRRRN